MENIPHKAALQYSLPEDEYKMFDTCRGQEELNSNINLESAFS